MNQTGFALTVLLPMTLVMGHPAILHPEDVTLRWNPNTEEDLAGYELFYGIESNNYTEKIDTGNITEYMVEDLTGGIMYFFALKAYDVTGDDSDFSDEVSYEVDQRGDEGASNPSLSGANISLPKRLALHQNNPNPFNPTTEITFDIPGATGTKERVSLTIYDLHGRRVRKLIDTELEPGTHRIVWDGKAEEGERVPSGIFLYTLRCKGKTFTKKFMVVK